MNTENQTPIQDENHIIAERREKLAHLRNEGVAFPNDFVPTHWAHRATRRKKYQCQSSGPHDAQTRHGQS